MSDLVKKFTFYKLGKIVFKNFLSFKVKENCKNTPQKMSL